MLSGKNIRTTRRLFARNDDKEDERERRNREDMQAVDDIIAALDEQHTRKIEAKKETSVAIATPPDGTLVEDETAVAGDKVKTEAIESEAMNDHGDQGDAEADTAANAEAKNPATTLMRREREHTVSAYPAHETASKQVLKDHGLDAAHAFLAGAAEMLLTEDHMIVRFDYHACRPGELGKRRYIIDVDMSYGRLCDFSVMELGPVG